ncbi:MAG: type II toxin-antitoxin system RelE/ParE family toxin [Betaproteobacteria bacterium]|nr:type II toxin-antitoxin system RelE/ParE family toxin [Betaproteobacteria bacterium]
MIKTFANKQTAALFSGLFVRQFDGQWARVAREKLKQINAAASIEFLRVPPGNRLEALKGDRKEQWSIRINEQWRICFRFEGGNAYDVEIVDYH